MTELLNGCVPKPGEPDLRGFGWWLLDRQSHVAHQVLLDCGSPVYILCYSPDRRLLATAGMDAVVRIVEWETGKISREIPSRSSWKSNGVAFSPDGNELATAGDDGTVRIWNPATGIERLKILQRIRQNHFTCCIRSTAVRSSRAATIRLINIFAADTGLKLQKHSRDTTEPSKVCFWPTMERRSCPAVTTKRPACGTSTPVWNCSRIRSRSLLVWPINSPTRIENLLMLGTDQGDVEIWNILESRKVSDVKHLDGVVSLALHPRGTFLAAGDRGGSIREWHLSARGEIGADEFGASQPRAWQAHQGRVHSLVYAGAGSRLISAGGDGRVVAWNLLATGPETDAMHVVVESANAFDLIPNTDSLMTSSGFERGLTRWNWKTGTQEARLAPFDIGNACCLWKVLARWTGALCHIGPRCAKVLSMVPLDEVFRRPPHESDLFEWNPGGAVGPPRFAPDSQSLAVRFQPDGTDGVADARKIWLHGPPNFTRREAIPIAEARIADFAPDGKTLALATDVGLVLWDLSNRSIAWQQRQPEIYSLAFSPNGKFLATGGVDRLAIKFGMPMTARFVTALTSHRAHGSTPWPFHATAARS